MAKKARKVSQAEPQPISVDLLDLDSENPRLVELGVEPGMPQHEILAILWREMAVDEVALSIAANGFFPHEFLFAEKKGSRYSVIEGNRRLAAVKLLRSSELRRQLKATDLPEISPSLTRIYQHC